MTRLKALIAEHEQLTRRYFVRLGALGAALGGLAGCGGSSEAPSAEWQALVDGFDLDYLTPEEEFRTVERGDPLPSTLAPEKLREAGLTRETWRLEVVPDPDSDARVENPLARDRGTALDWKGLMRLAETRAVRYLKVMSCNNVAGPLGMGLWEGVPLRDVIWMARPVENIRRVFYHGFHNRAPEQIFRSSLPIGRVLEDPPGELPVLLCYKLNGEWLTVKRGAPVRLLVPDAYGFKSVKWLTRVTLSNLFHANDTYAAKNNDIDSGMKTCARFVYVPEQVKAGQAVGVTGIAQSGMSGLAKVQYWLQAGGEPWPEDDPYFTRADWRDAALLPPPERWGGGLEGPLPPVPLQFDPATGEPVEWPLRNALVHWAALLPAIAAGEYTLRCRTIDAAGIAQPMPRPFRKSGRNAIQAVPLRVPA